MPRLQNIILSIAALVILASCQSAATNAPSSNLGRFNGKTMAAFMAETMITPTDYYDTAGKRVYVAEKRAPDPRFVCSMQIVALPNGVGSNADGWIIEQIRHVGGCAYI